jgi:hypothetical protein
LIRKSAVAVVAALALVGCSGSSSKTSAPTTVTPTIPPITSTTIPTPVVDPCALLTVQDASKLVGKPVKRTPLTGVAGVLACKYAAGTSGGAQITVKVDTDATTAHDEFSAWVQPIPGFAPGLTVTSVPNLGNEASSTRNRNVNDGIYVRRGATLVKIGAYPAVGDAALLAAAKTALARLRDAG